MMKFYALLFSLSILHFTGKSQFNYILTTSMETYTDLTGSISLNNGEVWDDPEYEISLPFTFELNGIEIPSLLFFGSGADLGFETSTNILTVVLPFSVDLIDRGAGGGTSLSPISYKVEGAPGNRILKIEWKNAGSYDEHEELGTTNMFVNFQLWLYEGSNRIEIHYGPSSITDPDLFYLDETGAIVAVLSVDFYEGTLIEPNILTGPASDPVLTDMEAYIDGTPEDGIVYRLTVNLPLEVEVVETPGTCGLANGSATANASGGVEPYSYLWSNGATTQSITDIEEGSFSVTVTDAGGSTAAGSVSITNQGAVVVIVQTTDETALDANDGTASALVGNGTPPYTYAWSNGSTDVMITGLAPGIYSLTVTDVDGCSGEGSATVNAFGCTDLLIEAALSHVNCFGACDVSIEVLEVTQGTAPFTYEWSTGGTESSIIDLCAGVYSVTVTDANGCTVSDTYSIFQPTELNANATSTNESAPGANDGTASAAPTGGIEPYTYEWSNGSTDQMITGLTSGSYTVIVTDANSCTDTQTVVVIAFACGPIDVQFENASCFDVCDGSISVILLAAQLPVAYLWNDNSTEALRNLLCPGTYSVTATDSDGCSAVASVEISEPGPVDVIAESTNETLEGANDGTAWAIPSGGTPPYTYAWSNGSTDSLTINLAPGSYTVTVTDANGCTDSASVDVLPGPCALLSATIINASCFQSCDGSILITLIGAVEPVTFFWSDSTTEASISNLCAGLYSVTATDAEGCITSGTIEITEPALLLANAGSINESLEGENDGLAWSFPLGGTAPYTYIWNNGSTDSLIVGLAPGSYRVTVTDANGCTDWQQVEVLVGPCLLLNPTIIHNTCNESCDGSIVLSVLGAVEPVTYLWGDSTTETSISNLCPGLYSVTATDADGCIISDTFEITEPDVLLANAGSTNETLEGANDATAWSAPLGGTSPYIYVWNNGSTDSLIVGLAPGSYRVTVTDANGCTDWQQVEVLVGPCALLISEVVHNTCYQSCDGLITVALVSDHIPVTYVWSTGNTGSIITDLCAGNYSVTASDTNGCIVVANFEITEPDELVANADHTDESAQNANNGTAWAAPTGGTPPYTFLWSTGETEAMIDSIGPGTYVVTVSDANGCTVEESVLVAFFVCLDSVIVTETQSILCFGECDGGLRVDVIGGIGPFTYLWNTGDTTAAIDGLCSSVYTVLVTDEGRNCVEFRAYLLDQPDVLTMSVDEVVHITDSTSSAIAISVAGGVLPYLFAWLGPDVFTSAAEDIFGIAPGFYTVTAADAHGCVVSIDSIEVRDETVGLSDLPKLDVRVYPNPAQDVVHLDVLDANEFQIQLHTADGRIADRYENIRTLNVSTYPEGIYLMKVTSGQKQFVYRLTVIR